MKDKEPETGLSARQEAVALALASGMIPSRITRKLKVSPATIYRWRQLPEFNARVVELRNELVDGAIGRLANLMAGKAADALEKLLTAKRDDTRLASVKAVYDIFVGVTNAAELKSRIEELEAERQA